MPTPVFGLHHQKYLEFLNPIRYADAKISYPRQRVHQPEGQMKGVRTSHLQRLIDRQRVGDVTARDELIACSYERLGELTKRMFKKYPVLLRWIEESDVLHNALIRLRRALEAVPLETVQDYMGLAAVQVRRECIDLVRHFTGREGLAANLATPERNGSNEEVPPAWPPPPPDSDDPHRLALWGELHERIQALPNEERVLFDLFWYQELTQTEAAEVLAVSVSTVKLRWQRARVNLYDAMGGHMPE